MTQQYKLIRRAGFSRPWPEGQPTRPGARCDMSDLLETECACKKHRGQKEINDARDARQPREAEEEELDFS